ncbi:MAG TPA: SDR family oxidoreductase [Ilumatobacteraceae bacterium]|nr:SDR family oxidoreductase [Ilumatobacteraceae bacterium]
MTQTHDDSQPQGTGRLAGKVCGITGATGIAEAAAVRFAAEGARLFVVALREEDCVALADRIAPSAELTWVAADLTDEAEAERAFAVCADAYGRLDALLACAGGSGRPFGDGPLHSTSLQSWNTTVALNLTTAFLSSREALRIMLDQPTGGSIVYISSVAATNPVAGAFNTLAYAAAKGGINSLTLNGACQYGTAGIRFNAILPALTLTPMSRRAASDPETLDIVKVRMPISGGGPLSADDHAHAALFLCSDESKHITGQLIRVDGGWGVN